MVFEEINMFGSSRPARRFLLVTTALLACAGGAVADAADLEVTTSENLPTNTVVSQPGGNINVHPGVLLNFIGNGGASSVTADGGNGTINNEGTVMHSGTDTLDINGDVVQTGGTIIFGAGSGDNTVTGDFTNTSDSTLNIQGGTAEVTGTLFNNSGTILNSGELTANIDNKDDLRNKIGGTILGNVTTSGDLNNVGLIDGTTFDVTAGMASNEGEIDATVTVSDGAVLINSKGAGSALITGDVTNSGALYNRALATITGTVINNDFVENSGLITGDLTNNVDATFENEASGTVDSVDTKTYGTLINRGEIDASNLVEVFNGGELFNYGLITGNVLGDAGSAITTTDEITGYLDTYGTAAAEGTVTGSIYVQNGADLTVSGDLDAGGLFVYDGATADIAGGDLNLTGATENYSSTGIGLTVGAGRMLTSTGLTNFSTGTLNVENSGIIDAPVINQGTIYALNAGFTGTLNNTGTFNALGATGVTGAAINNGDISMANGRYDDVLTFEDGLSGNGTYEMDVNLRAGDGLNQSDKIIVSGVTSGNLAFVFNTENLSLQDNPITVLDADAGETNTYTFSSTGLPQGGIIVYNLQQNAEDLEIASQVNPAIGGIAANMSLTQSMISTVVNRPSSPFVSGLATGEACTSGGFARGTIGRATVSGKSDNGVSNLPSEVSSNYRGLQAGWDQGCYDGRFGGWDLAFGAMVGLSAGSTRQNVFLVDPDNLTQLTDTLTSVTTTSFDQTSFGSYIAARKGKLTADIQLRYDDTSFELTDTPEEGFVGLGLDKTPYDSKALTLSTRVNYAFDLNENGLSFVPTAGLSYTRTKNSTITFEEGETLAIQDFNTTIGFIGGTIAQTTIAPSGTAGTTAFVSAVYYNDFADDRVSVFTDNGGGTQDITTNNLGGFGEASIGLNYVSILENGPAGAKQLNANIRADARFGPHVSDSYSLTAQMRLSF
jgi:fibronectin-binding autotransporter adhesin